MRITDRIFIANPQTNLLIATQPIPQGLPTDRGIRFAPNRCDYLNINILVSLSSFHCMVANHNGINPLKIVLLAGNREIINKDQLFSNQARITCVYLSSVVTTPEEDAVFQAFSKYLLHKYNHDGEHSDKWGVSCAISGDQVSQVKEKLETIDANLPTCDPVFQEFWQEINQVADGPTLSKEEK